MSLNFNYYEMKNRITETRSTYIQRKCQGLYYGFSFLLTTKEL